MAAQERTPANTTPQDVLDFWFGEGVWGTAKMGDESPAAFAHKTPLWWGFKADFSGPISADEAAAMDASCRAFIPLIRAAGAKELDGEWSTADGRFAQMLLCDQFSRGAFRGSPEAFGYDPRAMELCRGLFEDETYKSYTVAHWSFITTPCQHSEDPADHTIADAIMQFAKEKHADSPVCIQQVVNACAEHKAVVDKFGRYPHRNALKGRETTPEEQAWLDDKEHLPKFALAYVK